MIVQHNKPSLSETEISSVVEVLRSGFLAQGSRVKEFEKNIADYVGLPNCITVNSGTTSLYLALYALGIKEGDEVIIPTYVCSALLNAIFMHRAIPVLADINPDDYNISWNQVEEKITSITKAIIVPHIYGMPAMIPADTFKGIPIIEDCATALASTLDGHFVGTIGQLAILSFYATKYITTGEGGAIITADDLLANVIRDYREFDCRENYIPRFNFQMTNIQAALGITQLNRIPEFIARRRFIAEEYQNFFAGKGITWQHSPYNVGYNHYRFVVNLDAPKRDKLKRDLEFRNIKTIIPIEHKELLHNYLKLSGKKFPIAEEVANTTLSLPIYPHLQDAELAYILENLKKTL